jgi:hypothetical protein
MVGSGICDFGNFGVTMTRWFNSTVYTNSAFDAHYRSRFSKATEASLPGYYTAYLEDAETLAEVVAVSTHSGIHRYALVADQSLGSSPFCTPPTRVPQFLSSYTCYPRGDPSSQPCFLLLDACHTTSQESTHACVLANVSVSPDLTNPGGIILTSFIHNRGRMTGGGRNHGVDVYFYANITANAAIASRLRTQSFNATLWANNSRLEPGVTSAESASGNIGLVLEFPGAGAEVEVIVRVGLSFVDQAHAAQNLVAAQVAGAAWLEFDAAVDATSTMWESLLSRVVVAGAEDAGAAVAAKAAGLPPAARALAFKAARNSSLVDPQQVRSLSLVAAKYRVHPMRLLCRLSWRALCIELSRPQQTTLSMTDPTWGWMSQCTRLLRAQHFCRTSLSGISLERRPLG